MPITPTNVLLRGTTLRNTGSVLGAVLFTGHETKVFRNAMDPPSKRSNFERRMDLLVLGLFILMVTLAIIGPVFTLSYAKNRFPKMYYLGVDTLPVQFAAEKPGLTFVYNFVTHFILYGFLIPISMYVTLEVVKVSTCVLLINQDSSMYDPESGQFAQARTSNLNEELGGIQTVLSDKTGTLTRNVMEFFKCSIGGVVYGQGMT